MKRLPLGEGINELVNFATEHFVDQFRWISESLSGAMAAVSELIAGFPIPVVIATLAAIALGLKRDLKLAVLTVLGLSLIANLEYWQATIETLTLVAAATLVSCVIGIPVGVVAAHRPRIYQAINPLLDMMQTIPTFVYLLPTLMLFGLGLAPGLISTVVFAMPAPIRLTYLGIRSVPHELKEMANAFGASPWQLLLKVELPHARQAVMAGMSQCIMLSLSMVVIAALVGADGLGKPVVQALNTVNIARGFESGLAIVIVAILLDRFVSHAKVSP